MRTCVRIRLGCFWTRLGSLMVSFRPIRAGSQLDWGRSGRKRWDRRLEKARSQQRELLAVQKWLRWLGRLKVRPAIPREFGELGRLVCSHDLAQPVEAGSGATLPNVAIGRVDEHGLLGVGHRRAFVGPDELDGDQR